MALTSQQMDIARPQHGAVEPQNTVSPLTTILDSADKFLGANDALAYNNRIDSQLQGKAAESEIASKSFFLTANANNVLRDQVPPSTAAATDKLNTIKAGVDQGTLPTTAYQTNLQNLYAQELSKYPGQADVIMQYARQNGHEHVMFSDLEGQRAQQMALQQGQDQALTFGVDYARKNGVDPTLPLNDQASYGLKLSYARDQQTAAAQAAEAAQKNFQISQQAREAALKEAQVTGLSAVQDEIGIRTNSIFDSTRNLISGIGSDTERESTVSTKLLPAIDNAAAQAKASAHNHLVLLHIGTEENFKSVDSLIDSQVAGVKAVFSDKTGGLQKTLENLKTSYGIDTAKAAPLLYKLGSLIGNNQVAAMLGPTSMLDPKVQQQIGREWAGLTAPGDTDGQQHLSNIVSLLNGNTNLKDYTEAQASQYIGAIATGKNASEGAILQDAATHQDSKVYLNTSSNLLNATHQLTPASSLQSLEQASRLVANQGSRLALDKLTGNPLTEEQATAVGMASHLTSIKLLQNFQQHAPEGLNRYQSIQYDNKAGQYYVKFDADAFRNDPGMQTNDPRLAGIRLGSARQISQSAQDQVTAMNNTLDHATKTSKYDTDIPKGTTPLDIRNAIATNQQLKDKSKVDPNKAWSASEQAVEDKLRAFPTIIQQQDQARQGALNAPSGGIHSAIMAQESGGNPNAVSNKGAVGTMQTMPNTLKDPGFGVTPAKDNSPEELARVGRDYFDALRSKYGNDPIALAAYNWGPAHIDQWIQEGANFAKLPAETREYVSSVLMRQALRH